MWYEQLYNIMVFLGERQLIFDMKVFIVFCFLLIGKLPMFSQYVELPVGDIYDTDVMMAHMNAVRDANAVDRRLADEMKPIVTDLFEKYNRGEYRECKNRIDDIFSHIRFYKRQYWIYSPLYYLRGMSLMELGDKYDGIKDLVYAKEANNSDATEALCNYFLQFCDNANQYFQTDRLNDCLHEIQLALSTSYCSAQIYMVAGKVYEKWNLFDTARDYYKLAKKRGSTKASKLLKELRQHRKKYEREIRNANLSR